MRRWGRSLQRNAARRQPSAFPEMGRRAVFRNRNPATTRSDPARVYNLSIRRVHEPWGPDHVADRPSFSKQNPEILTALCVLDISVHPTKKQHAGRFEHSD
jgi:hypothetical protein